MAAHAGGRPVHVIGWSLGGIFSLLTAADRSDLPIASLTVVGSPFDVSLVPLVAPLRPLLNLTEGRGAITRAYRLMGGAPKPLVKWAFQLSSFQKLVTKPVALATHLDDADFLAQIEAVDRFTDGMIAYPGRTFGQLYHRFVKGNALRAGEMELGDRTIRIADINVPVLVFAGATDGIAPVAAVKAMVPLLTGARRGPVRDRPRRAPRHAHRPCRPRHDVAGHGRVDRRSGRARRRLRPSRARPRRRPPPRRPSPRSRPPGSTVRRTGQEGTGQEAARGRGGIGVNPTRRYGSAGSRSLAR